MMCKCFGIAAASALLLTGSSLQAASLLQENWNSGTIGANWVVSEDQAADIDLQNLGGGDFALALRGSQDPAGVSPSWSDNIRSAASFSRASQLQLQFLAWRSTVNAQVGLHGGFHNAASSFSYNQIEAALDYVVNDIRSSEATYDGPNGIQSGRSEPAFTTALANATSKNRAVLVRLTLDQVRGAKFEYATNAGVDPFITMRDSRGQATYNGQGGPKNTGSASTVWLGWGNFFGAAGTTYIDDIVLSSVPEPSSMLLAVAACAGLLVRRRNDR